MSLLAQLVSNVGMPRGALGARATVVMVFMLPICTSDLHSAYVLCSAGFAVQARDVVVCNFGLGGASAEGGHVEGTWCQGELVGEQLSG